MAKVDWNSVNESTNGGNRPTVGGCVLTIINATEKPENSISKSNGTTTRANGQAITAKMPRKTTGGLPRLFRSYKPAALGMLKHFLISWKNPTAAGTMDRWNSLPDARSRPRP